MNYQYIHYFKDIAIDDIPLVGGKNASLGEMYRELSSQAVKVPNGFAVSAQAYRYVLDYNDCWDELHSALDGLDADNMDDLAQRGKRARDIVYGAELPADLQVEIISAYHELQAEYGPSLSLAVRSSATAEDLPTASFAGQQDTYLNVSGDKKLLDACHRCFASLFTDRAIHYRIDNGFDHFKVALSIGIMKMVRSDLASSGVMFSLDTESGFRDAVFITGAYGLGENVVQGAVDPDEFYVHKPTFNKGYRTVLRRVLGAKKIKMIYADGNTKEAVRNIVTPKTERSRFCIEDKEVLTLTDYAIKIEKYYSDHIGHDKPMDMEWAKDGLDGQLYIVQARPETVSSQKSANILEEYHLKGEGKVLAVGRSAGAKIASGQAHFIKDSSRLNEFKAGEVLLADSTTPDWEPIMKIAAAIVTNRGGRTCHAAIVARELGIPAVIGADQATEKIKNGEEITVSCAEGDSGKIYQGKIPFEVRQTDLSTLSRPVTDIMLNLGNPELAFKTSFLPNDGVGLARMEFIINEYIKIHPMALLHPEKIKDDADKAKVKQLTQGYSKIEDYFVQRLSEGVGTIAAAFYPKPVVVRMSDFKSNEYAALIGGRAFEPEEANPMLGLEVLQGIHIPTMQKALLWNAPP